MSIPHCEGVVDVYADGGYPLFYLTADCAVLCPSCVNHGDGSIAHVGCALLAMGATDPAPCADSDPQWCVVGADVNWEDAELYCDHCNERIPSAYAEPEESAAIPLCALAMGCLCAGHARGNPASDPCDTRE